MSKKALGFFAFILALCFLSSVSENHTVKADKAEGEFKKYSITSPNISIQFPDNYYVFWNNMPANDISISASGSTPEHWDTFFKSNPDMVLYAESTDSKYIINLTYDETDTTINLNSADNGELIRYISNWVYGASAASGIVNPSYKYVKTDQFTFIMGCYERTVPETQYEIMAATIEDNKKIRLSCTSDSPITDEYKKTFQNIAVSLSINSKEPKLDKGSKWMSKEDISYYPVTLDNITMKLPYDYFFVTKNSKDNDISLVEKGTDVKALKAILESENIELFAFNNSEDEFLHITKQPNDTYDMQSMSYNEIMEMLKPMTDYLTVPGGTNEVNGSVITPFMDSNINYWFRIHEKDPANKTEIVYYIALVDGIQYNVTFENDSLTEEIRLDHFDTIVKNIWIE